MDMDLKYKEKLCRNSELITETVDAEHVCLYLNGTVLTPSEVDKIYAGVSRQDRARRLLCLLLSKDTLAYQHFRYALRERHSDVVQRLDDTAISSASATGDECLAQQCVLRRRDTLILGLRAEALLGSLLKEGVLDSKECNRVRAGATRADKARLLMDALHDKGPQVYRTFSLVVRAMQPELGKIFDSIGSI